MGDHVKQSKYIFFILILLSLKSFSQDPQHWENLIDAADTWKYIIPSSELPANWTDPDFDDSSWLSGPGGIGYGDGDDRTTVPVGTISVFMRKNFTLADASELVSAFLYVDYDDGFVAYLNGTEIARANIGTVGVIPPYNALADKIVEPSAASGGLPYSYPVDSAKLVSSLKYGNNVLALQFHNQAATSSDLSSTTYFIAGFSNSSGIFRSPPYWFNTPVSGNSLLPLIVIDTWGGAILNEPKIDAWIKIINKGAGQINNINDPATDFEGNIGIEIRGQSSQMFPKKGYGFQTRNVLKGDSAISLLGMPAENDWILSAPYSDKTMMRNPLTYYLGNQMSRWQPRTRWCELYLNGNYMGVYFLVEKIKRDKKRVHIDHLYPNELAGDSLTGGYIVKVDKLDGLTTNDYFRATPSVSYKNARNYDFTYVYPKSDEIMPEQKTYIRVFLTQLENVLNGSNFKDPATGFRLYLDEMSFVEFQIIQELTNNVDGYRYSTFFYKDKNSNSGKLVAGPLWDFDLCYGNVDYSPRNLATNQWLYTNYGPNEGYPMHWWARLMEDPDYKNLVKWRYSILRRGPLNTDSIIDYLDLNQAYLGLAIDRNFQRWPILDQYVWPNPEVRNTYDNEMDFLKTWISNRLTWLDSQWLISLNTFSPVITNNNFLAYPNPFCNRINLKVNPVNLDNLVVDLYNLQGQKILSQTFQIYNTTVTELYIENINLPQGLYFLSAHQSGQIIANTKLICSGENR
jgi:hypothetical protein